MKTLITGDTLSIQVMAVEEVCERVQNRFLSSHRQKTSSTANPGIKRIAPVLLRLGFACVDEF